MATEASLASQVLALATGLAKVEQTVEGSLGKRGEKLQAALTALDLGPLQDAIDHLEDRTAGLQQGMESISPLRDGLTALTEQVGQLRKDLTALASESEEKLQLWDWTAMDQQQASDAWAALIAWVRDVLAGRYGWVGWTAGINAQQNNGSSSTPLPRIPPCWYRHESARWELSWLCQEWLKLYTTSHGTPSKAGDWHDRYAPGVRRRVSAALAACAKGRVHVDDTPETTIMPLGIDDDEAMSSFVGWDLQQRRSAPAPGPVPAST